MQTALQTDQVRVNSLHMQGINRLAENLVCEAKAPDGLIEAFRLDSEDRFVLEWPVAP